MGYPLYDASGIGHLDFRPLSPGAPGSPRAVPQARLGVGLGAEKLLPEGGAPPQGSCIKGTPTRRLVSLPPADPDTLTSSRSRNMSTVSSVVSDADLLDCTMDLQQVAEDGVFNISFGSDDYQQGTISPLPGRDAPKEDQGGTVTPTPREEDAEDHGVVYLRELPPLAEMYDDDEVPGAPRLQLLDFNGHRFGDSELMEPKSWYQIAAVRRGVRPTKPPYSATSYEDYFEMKSCSTMRSCNYHVWDADEKQLWGAATPACVTVYKILQNTQRHGDWMGQYWATIETMGGPNRFSNIEVIMKPAFQYDSLMPVVEQNRIIKVSRKAGRNNLPAGAQGKNKGARGGVKGQGPARDPGLAPRPSAVPYRRDQSFKKRFNKPRDNHDHRRQDNRRSNSTERKSPPAPKPAVRSVVLMPPPAAPEPAVPAGSFQWVPAPAPSQPPAAAPVTPASTPPAPERSEEKRSGKKHRRKV